ncbi:MAG: cation diffusion facilitator family transporter [Candidatus Omnitrophica bacterium]|nr:cation diffusion facilitator family transporter [Candidatus Omnitrophota bacterium]
MSNNRVDKANRVTWIGLYVNIGLTLFKLIAGVFGQSAAMIADAFHSLSDFATDVVVLLGFRFIAKPVDKSHDYGHGKAETLSSVIIGLALFAVGFRIFWVGLHSIYHVYHGELIPEPGVIAFYAAIISIISKEGLYRYTMKTGRAINSSAVIANAWHHRSDTFSSIGTMLGIGGAILLGEKWRILDPIAALVVSVFIIQTSIRISLDSFNELLEASLSDEFEKKILDIIKSVSGVISPHELRTRRIGNYIAIDVHIEVNKELNIKAAHDISTEVEKKIKAEFGEETFIYVHVEPAK